jgi:alginate O-acetyltransferase complex protein AlgI
MNYTTTEFLWFYVIVFICFYLLRNARLQVLLLVVVSLIFYAWENPSLLAVFLSSWLITSLSSFGVLTAATKQREKTYAFIGVLVNLGLLAFFKYKFLFWNGSISNAAGERSVGEQLLMLPLPIGISFYSFHGISLLVDAYRGSDAIKVNLRGGLGKHLLNTLLYLAFFPQLIAGPIIKAKDFYPQVELKKFSDIDWTVSFRLLVTGYFLKSVIADNLAEQTFWIAFPYFQWKTSADLLLLLYGYSAQIFADYGGYSLIAIGLARLLGYKLPHNFNFPYISTSISEFWRRWNMSLSSFLRDYLYIPLGGNKKGEFRTYLNLIIVMFLGGLWHGAAWSFAIWGLWHGIGLALERPFMNTKFMSSKGYLARVSRMFLVFNFATIGWLFFKLQEFEHAELYLRKLFINDAQGFNSYAAYFILIFSLPVFLYHVANLYRDKLPTKLKDACYGVMIFLILTNAGPVTPFIYFQF